MSTTRMSSIMASTILRTFSAWASSRRGEIDFADLGDAFDDVGDLLAKLGVNLVDGDGGVFHRVVQQAGGDGGGVEAHLGQHGGYFQRMHQVRLARRASLAF